MRSAAESNSINRILKAWGIGSLEDSAAVPALARMVQDHEHFGEILRACEPGLRRDMYDAMSPNLRFKARAMEWYEIGAKEHAESMQYPTMTPEGGLKPYLPASIGNIVQIDIPEYELWLQCHKCKKESFFYTERKADSIATAREAGWAFDEMGTHHLCPNCLDAYAMDEARQVKKLLSKGSPLTGDQQRKMKEELHRNPALGHAKKGSAALKKK